MTERLNTFSVTLAQLNPTMGDVEGNAAKVRAARARAAADGADLVLFREMDGTARCISNVCPHRGSSLAEGILYKDGTLSCPFHGYRFN